MSDANGQTVPPFAQAARAAEELLDRLQGYEAALSEISELREGVGGLKEEVAAAKEPTARFAASARSAAETFGAVEAAREEVQKSLASLNRASSQAAQKVGARVGRAADQAAGTIEAQAVESAKAVGRAAQAVDAALGRATQAAEALEGKVAEDGGGAAKALVGALETATAQVRQDATRTVKALVDPAEQASRMFERAKADADELRGVLQETREGLRREVAGAVASLRQGLADADAEFRANRATDLRRVVQLAWATFAAVVVIGAGLLMRGGAAEPGLPLAESTVQVLNGVDHAEDYAAEVAALLSVGSGIDVKATVRGDAPTTRQMATYVLVHGASMEAGRELAAGLGLEAWRVRPGAPVPYSGQLTVLLGEDFRDAIPALP